jgi:hypothetical protein
MPPKRRAGEVVEESPDKRIRAAVSERLLDMRNCVSENTR